MKLLAARGSKVTSNCYQQAFPASVYGVAQKFEAYAKSAVLPNCLKIRPEDAQKGRGTKSAYRGGNIAGNFSADFDPFSSIFPLRSGMLI